MNALLIADWPGARKVFPLALTWQWIATALH